MFKKILLVVFVVLACFPIFAARTYFSAGLGFDFLRDFDIKQTILSPGIQLYLQSRFDYSDFGFFFDGYFALPVIVNTDDSSKLNRKDFDSLGGFSAMFGPCYTVTNNSRTMESNFGLGFAANYMKFDGKSDETSKSSFGLGVGVIDEMKFYFNNRFYCNILAKCAYSFTEYDIIRNKVEVTYNCGSTKSSKLDLRAAVGFGICF